MRILLLTPYLPHPALGHGTATVAGAWLDHFSSRHDVSVLCFETSPGEREAARSLAARGIRLRTVPFPGAVWARRQLARVESLFDGRPFLVGVFRSREMSDLVRGEMAAGGYDLVQADTVFMAQYLERAPGTAARVLLEIDVSEKPLRRRYEVERSFLRRWRNRGEWRRMRRYEPLTCRWFDRVYAVSREDQALLRSLDPSLEVSLFRYGVRPSLFALPPPDPGGRVVAFVGNFMHPPNVDAATWFCSEVLPGVRARVGGVEVRIVGASPPASVRGLASAPGVRVTGRVESVDAQLAEADVCVVPLRWGGGVKLKTLEMLASARPVVTTSVGAEGIDVVDGEHAFVADEAGVFADRVVRLLEDPSLRRDLGARGRRLAERDHRWEASLEGLEREYEALVAEARGEPGPGAAPRDLSIVVPSYRTPELLETCLRSVFAHPPRRPFEVVVVDDDSRDATAGMVRRRFPAARLIVNRTNLGYARSNNLAIARSRGRYVYLLNSDAEVLPGALDALLDFLDARPEAGAAASVLDNGDGTVQASAKAFPSLRSAFFGKRSPLARIGSFSRLTRRELLAWKHAEGEPFEVGYASSASLMLRREVIERVGELDPRFWHFIDADYCRRVADAGWRVFCVPAARVVHREHRGGTLGSCFHRFRSVWTFHYGAYVLFRKHSGRPAWHPLTGLVFAGLGARFLASLAIQLLKEASGYDRRRYARPTASRSERSERKG